MPNPTHLSPLQSQDPPEMETIDAVAFLKQEHRRIAEWFDEYDSARSNVRKQELALRICRELRVHAAMEEDLFYPALLRATDDPVRREMAVLHEHTDSQRLIEQIMQSSPIDELFDSRVRILADVIAQHVEEEECPGGIFEEAEQSGMDLPFLGIQLQVRRHQLEQW
ncbi:MAG: hemerythrin protein [Gammaproteobacteria bacterium]|nr:hemerythrin protein [Gammaproteobacteria bacterium]